MKHSYATYSSDFVQLALDGETERVEVYRGKMSLRRYAWYLRMETDPNHSYRNWMDPHCKQSRKTSVPRDPTSITLNPPYISWPISKNPRSKNEANAVALLIMRLSHETIRSQILRLESDSRDGQPSERSVDLELSRGFMRPGSQRYDNLLRKWGHTGKKKR